VRRYALLASLLLACAPPQGRDSFVLRIALWGPLGQLRPTDTEGALASIAASWIFDKIASVDDTGRLRPSFATAIERLPGSRYRIALGRQRTFSDGSPVTDEDVIRSLTGSGLRVEPSGEGDFLVEAHDPGLPPEALILNTLIYRKTNGQFLGSGPFFVASESEHELRLVRRNAQRDHVNEVRLIAYATSRDAFSHTLKGDANLIFDLEPRWREFFDGVPSLRVLKTAGRSTDALIFNSALSRQERLALAATLTAEPVRDQAYGDADCSESRTASPEQVPLPPGRPLEVLGWGPFERLALSARRGLGERGGEVTVAPPAEVLSRMKARRFDLVTARPLMWPPSTMSLIWRTGAPQNLSGYSNPALDKALDAGDWAAAEAALRADPPAAFVCTRDKLAVVDARIKNARLGPYEILETLPEWEVTQ